MVIRFGICSLLLVAMASCGDGATEPRLDPDAPIQTGSQSYTLESTSLGAEAEIDFVFTNLSDETIYFPNCAGDIHVIVEHESESGWQGAAGSGYPDCLGPVIEVAPGASASSSVHIAQYDPESNFCCGFVDGTEPPGIYRIRVTHAVRDYDMNQYPFGEDVEEEYLISNRFRIN